jgi:membrane protein YqaA with SNARE-associated domain
MLRRLYDWLIGLAASRWALPALAAVSFAESSFLPLPPDTLLAPMVLARPRKAWLYAGVCTLGSVVGGLFGYAIGFYLAPFAVKLLAATGHPGALAAFQVEYGRYGLWVILIKGLTPIPYKLVTIASGLAKFNLAVFFGASVATRGARFFLEAALLQHPKAKVFVDKHLGWAAAIVIVTLVLAVVAIKFIG